MWKELVFADAFRRVLRKHRQLDAARLLRVMVFNQLCAPESRLAPLRRLEGIRVLEAAADAVTHQRLLRTMDTLSGCAEAMDSALAGLLRPLIDQKLWIVFHDLTKKGCIAKQVMLGAVQTAEDSPIRPEVFAGNTGETTTPAPTIAKVLTR